MTPTEREQKLDTIRKLPADQLRGWFRYVQVPWGREPFDGELAALHSRARSLGVTLSEVPV